MDKEAKLPSLLYGNIIPSGEQISTAFKAVAPPAFAAGVSYAGLKALINQLNQNREEKEQTAAKNQSTLVVQIPQPKTAGGEIVPYVARELATVAPEAAQAAQRVFPRVINKIRSSLGSLGQSAQQMGLAGGQAGAGAGAGAAAAGAGAGVGAPQGMSLIKKILIGTGGAGATGAGLYGLLGKIPDAKPSPNLIWNDGLLTLAGVGAGMAGYSGVNSIIENRQKQQLQQRLESAKKQYSHLLGYALEEKTAELDECFPVLQGFCCRLAEDLVGPWDSDDFLKLGDSGISYITSAPSAAGVIAMMLAHKFVYDRMKEVDAMHAYEKPRPPKQIQLVSTPAPQPLALPAPQHTPQQAPQEEQQAEGLKAANAYGTPSTQVDHYNPIVGRRELSPEETAEVAAAKNKLLPKIFASNQDPISARMSSPTVPTALGAGLGSMAGGVIGTSIGGIPGGALGVLLGALGGGTLGYQGNRVGNENLEEAMHRLPEGQTRIRDLKSDPVYQGEQDRQTQMASNLILANALSHKMGDLEELAGGGALLAMLGGHHDKPKEKEPAASAAPHIVDNNTSEIVTPEGNIGVTATDPATAATLGRNTNRLAKIMASLQTQQVAA